MTHALPAIPPLDVPAALQLLTDADAALESTLDGADEPWLRQPSLCAGWTRAHVLAHLGRNSAGMQRLVTWAQTGVETPAYDSLESRAADIENDAQLDLPALRERVREAAQTFTPRAQELVGRDDLTPVRTGSSAMTLPGDQIPWARLREVTIHHVDLDTGFTFDDADPRVVDRALWEAADKAAARPDCPALTLVDDQGRRWPLGDGDEVLGSTADLLLWLARGVDHGLEFSGEGPLPAPPWWG